MGNIACVGTGFTGSVIARELANSGFQVDIFDARSHVAGNCHTERDPETNILLHVYGPHIFHTSNIKVWNYVNQYDEFEPFTNRVKAISGQRVYSLPINLLTINSFFGKTLSPAEALNFLDSIRDKSIKEPKTFEEQALSFVGKDLYEAFFKGYTLKQWGVEPCELPASILKRLPLRFDYNDNYYSSKFQGIPKNGYTFIIEKILDHSNINVHLNSHFDRSMSGNYEHVFYSGAIDEWFNHSHGRLGYRTLDFELERHEGNYQGNPVINYCDQQIPWTRISEHKHFAPWETHSQTVIYKEYSRQCQNDDIPYYPVRLVHDKNLLSHYVDMAKAESNITFVGRLGTYRYLDMHVSIAEAIETAELFKHLYHSSNTMPSFVANPL